MIRRIVLPLVALMIAGSVPFAAAQGSLTPPGAPAPTMKTLDQIYEAVTTTPATIGRTPIFAADLPLTISAPGSYYLAESINFTTADAHGITIESSDVSIDLNGFTLQGPGAAAPTTGSIGIRLVNGPARVAIENGTVRDWPTAGIAWSNAVPSYGSVRRVNVFDIGGVGISMGSGATIEDCLVVAAANSGVVVSDRAAVRRCFVRSLTGGTTSTGINVGANSLVEDSQAQDNAGRGFATGLQTTFINCRAVSNGSNGFHADGITDIRFRNCSAYDNAGNGFAGSWRTEWTGCVAQGNSQHGIQTTGTSPQGMRIVDCLLAENSLDGLNGIGSFRGTVTNSQFILNGNDGIDVGSGWAISNNQCNGNGTATGFTTGAGIRTDALSTVRGNTCQANDIGIAATAATSYFALNLLTSNTTAKSLSGSTEGAGDNANVTF